MAGQWAISGQNGDLSGQDVPLLVMLMGHIYLIIIPQTCVGYELSSSYPTSVSGIIVLF